MRSKEILRLAPALVSVAGSAAAVGIFLFIVGKDLGVSWELSLSMLAGLLGAAGGFFAKQLEQRIRSWQRSPRVFFSYPLQTELLAQRLSAALRDAGAKVWADTESLRQGESVSLHAEKALRDSDAFLILLSGDESPYVLTELRMARDKGLKLIPVVLGDADVPADLTGVSYFRLAEGERKIVQAVLDAVSSEAHNPAPQADG